MVTKLPHLLTVIFGFFAGSAVASDLANLLPGTNEVQVRHDGQSRRLLITTPTKFNGKEAHPVLFCFHGAGGQADGQSARWSPHANERNVIIISAEAVHPLAKWNFKDHFHSEAYDDVGFVMKVIDVLLANKIADPQAIYATGHSSGGLFCYRLAAETDRFAALAPMSCGMAKGAHDPNAQTKPVSIIQVIGDQDKSFNGTSNPKVTMYSAARRIDIWRSFNRCLPNPVVKKVGEKIVMMTYHSPSGAEVGYCKVIGEGHHIETGLRDRADTLALDFLFSKRKP